MALEDSDIESQSWKPIVIGAASSIVLLMLAYFFMSTKSLDFLNVGLPEKVVTFNKVHLIGREAGKKIWELKAQTGWATKGNQINILEHVTDGATFKQEKPVVKELFARRVKVYKNPKDIEAFAFVVENGTTEGELLKAKINLSKITTQSAASNKKARFASIKAEYLKYDRDHKRSLTKNVIIYQDDITIDADVMDMDHEKNEAVFTGNLKVNKNHVWLYCDKIISYPEKEIIVCSDNVRTIIKDKQKTNVNCNQAIIYSENESSIEAFGDLEIFQKNKGAKAERAVYYENDNIVHLFGNVKCIIEKTSRILRKDAIDRIDSPEGKKIIEEKTFITAESFSLSTQSGDILAKGNVYVSQKGRLARSDYAKYTENEDQIILTDNVWLKEEKGWVKTNKVLVSVKDETFEAFGQVETIFKIKK